MSMLERMKQLLSAAKDTDVHFLVGEGEEKELLPAHKLFLTQASDVFERMFSFDAENSKVGSATNPIVVPDVAVDTFMTVLSFIYTDDLSGMNGDNAMKVIYAANKYHITALTKACLDFSIGELPNVFVAYKQALILEKKFARRILAYICKSAETFFQSDVFLEIDRKFLHVILARDQLEIDGGETSIWEAALRWADAQCRKNGTVCSAENRRAMLGSALFKIRFPLIPRREFFVNIVPSGILTIDELMAVYCDAPKLYPLRFSTQERISYRKEGTLTMEIEKLSEFAREEVNSRRISQNATYIGGFPWKILVLAEKRSEDSTENWLGVYLWCNAPKKDTNWICKCPATFRIVSQKSGTEDFTRKFEEDKMFNRKYCACGFSFMTFEDLMNVDKGFYNREEDKVKLAIDVSDVVRLPDKTKFDFGVSKH